MIDQGTLNVFEEIYKDTFKDVSKYVVCRCHNMDDINDIIQNVYYDVLKCKNLKDIKDVHKYVMTISKNKVNDYYRFSYRYKIFSFLSQKDNLNVIETVKDDVDIENSARIKFAADLVWDYLKKKDIIVFKIFYLYYSLELTIKEISIELNISESKIKNCLYRTLKELRRLGDDYV